MEQRYTIVDYVKASYNFIPINCRAKTPRSVVFIDIAESLRLTLHTINYKLITEVLEELGARRVETHGYKYWKGLVHKSVPLTEDHTRIIHSCGSHSEYKLAPKGHFVQPGDQFI